MSGSASPPDDDDKLPPDEGDDWDPEDFERQWLELPSATHQTLEDGEQDDGNSEQDAVASLSEDFEFGRKSEREPANATERRKEPPAEKNQVGKPLAQPDLLRKEAIDLEAEFWRTRRRWTAVKAAQKWKFAKDPHRAILFALSVRKAGYKFPKREGASLLTTLASSYIDMNRPNTALHRAEIAIRLNPNTPHAYNVAGKAENRLGRQSRADQYFSKARELEREIKLNA